MSVLTMCVVGNGQSPIGHGDFIDSHDFVVRVNGWWITHKPPAAGRKVNAWAWNSALYFVGLREAKEKNRLKKPPPAGNYELWVEAHRGGKKHIRNAQMAVGIIGRRKICWMDKKADNLLTHWLRKLAKRRVVPSTGLRAVCRAVHRLKAVPALLSVIGFDATKPDKPGWGDKGNPWRKTWRLHDFVAEKQVLASLVDGRKWLGSRVAFKTDWVGRPE
jgi:hypothetical protein